MKTETSSTGKRVADLWPRLVAVGRILRARLISSYMAAALAAPVQPAADPAPTADSEMAQFASRVSDMLRQVAAWRPVPAPAEAQALVHSQQAAIQKLAKKTGGDALVHIRPSNQTVRQIGGRALKPADKAGLQAIAASHEQTVRDFFRENRALMRLIDPENELALIQQDRDDLGHHHLWFRQQYRGLPVWPAGLGAHFDSAGRLTLVDGAYAPTPNLEGLRPGVTGAEAVARARAAFAQEQEISVSVPQLIIYAPLDQPPQLAWKFELTASLTAAWLVVVSAQDGTILHQSSRVCDVNVAGSGVDLFGATRPLNVWQNGDTYYMVDTSKDSFDPAFDPILNPHGVITVVDANGATPDTAPQAGTIVTASTASLWSIPAAISAAYNFS